MWRHVIIGIKHDCVCIVGVKLPGVLSRRGAITRAAPSARQHPREFDTNKYTHSHVYPLNQAWKSNHTQSKIWGDITYPFPNVNACTVEVWECISYLIAHLIMDLIISSQTWWSRIKHCAIAIIDKFYFLCSKTTLFTQRYPSQTAMCVCPSLSTDGLLITWH